MGLEQYDHEALRQLGAEMFPRVLETIDPLEKEVCVDAARGDRDRKRMLLIVFSTMLLERSVMGLAAIGVPWDVIARKVEGSYSRGAGLSGARLKGNGGSGEMG